MIAILAFWAVCVAVGIVGIPFASFLFARLPGRGLLFARALGTILITFPLWLAVSIGLVSYSTAAVIGTAILVAIAGALLAFRSKPTDLKERMRQLDVRLWLTGEVIFTVAFFAFAALRAFSPEAWGTERPMDLAFMSSLDRTSTFPPPDPWMSGESLNYYYFGHYVSSFLSRFVGVVPEVGYNLALTFFFALTTSTVFGLASELYMSLKERVRSARRVVIVGLSTAVMTMILGNLAGVGQLFQWEVGTDFDWWSPSRVIEGAAAEFPFFSYLLGDLHGHVLVVPFALVAMAFSLQIALAGPRLPFAPRPKEKEKETETENEATGEGLSAAFGDFKSWGPAAAELVLGGIVFGSLLATNTLDFPTASVILLGGALIYTHGHDAAPWKGVVWAAAVLVVSLVAFAPFIFDYQTATDGIGVITPTRSFVPHLIDTVVIFGLFIVLLLPFLRTGVRDATRELSTGLIAFLAALILVLATLLGLPGFLWIGLMAVAGYQAVSKGDSGRRFLWALLAVAFGLMAVVGFVYIRDAFVDGPDYRFNTVFKFGYQAWFLMAVAAGVAFWHSRDEGSRSRIWTAVVVLFVAGAAIYPAIAPVARVSESTFSAELDGLEWLREKEPDDVAAIEWLRANAEEDATVLESLGGDYDFDGRGRVSTYTGIPAVLQWPGHQLQWSHDPGTRLNDITHMYNTSDLDLARSLIDTYEVDYVVVGSLERKDYSPTGLEKFEEIGERVFSSGRTVVYRVSGEEA